MWVSKLCWKKSQHTKRKTTSDWVMIKGYCTSDAVVIWDKDTLLIFLIFCFIPFTAIVNIHPEKQNRNVNFLRSSHSVLHYDKSPPQVVNSVKRQKKLSMYFLLFVANVWYRANDFMCFANHCSWAKIFIAFRKTASKQLKLFTKCAFFFEKMLPI